jgi:SAM-dependent MidA family methyltransferase
MSKGPLESLLLERIAAQGPMPFAAFMQIALYHRELGYYARPQPRTGWAGHFVTSPEIDPAFGALWTRAFEQIWFECGKPPRFQVTEVGPGEGALAAAILATAKGDFADALELRLVERNPELQERQRRRLEGTGRVSWSESIVDLPGAQTGVVFANEVIDNLPVHLVRNVAGALCEECVTATRGVLAFESLPPSNPELQLFLKRTNVTLPEGHRMEVPLAAESFMSRAAGTLARGAVLLVDYGDEAGSLAARPEGTLACYSATGADDVPLADPGAKDITAHANWTALRAAGERAGLEMIGPRPQHEVLTALGLKDLDKSLEQGYHDALSTGAGAAAVASLSRRHALRALVDAGGLGALGVMAGLAGISRPAFLT